MAAIFDKGLNPATAASIVREITRVDRSDVLTLTASATIKPEHSLVLVDTTGGSVAVTLPPARKCKGRFYRFKKLVAANTMTLVGNGAETIDGAATAAISAQYGNHTIASDGSNWHTF
jgi:hypothetical protein